MITARIFRLFISLTFSDFIAEREALQHKVFPELEKYCAECGARFQAVDLRWGVTDESQREHLFTQTDYSQGRGSYAEIFRGLKCIS